MLSLAAGRAEGGGGNRPIRLALPPDATGYAASLFAALHDVDGASVDALVLEDVPVDEAWWAVRDRLARAARA